MIKTKPKEIIIPSRIITTKKASIGFNKKGIIQEDYQEQKTVFQIILDKPDEKAHTFKGLLPSKKGIFLKQEEFTVLPIEKDKEKFELMMKHCHYKTLMIVIQQEIKECKSKIRGDEDALNYHLENLKEIKETAIKNKELLKTLKTNSTKDKIENYANQYEKILKHPKIERIKILSDYIIITTTDLTYYDGKEQWGNFNLGAYHIFIPKNCKERKNIQIINYKKQYKQGVIFHPCIKEEGRTCTGAQLSQEVNGYLKKNQIAFVVFCYLNFLEHPNEKGPYMNAHQFRCAQDVTFKPKNILDYLKQDEWYKHEKWDEKKYYKDIITAYQKDLKREEDKSSPDDNFITTLCHYIDTNKSHLKNI